MFVAFAILGFCQFIVDRKASLDRLIILTAWYLHVAGIGVSKTKDWLAVQKHLDLRIGNIAAVWGVLGSCSILGIAIARMLGHVNDASGYSLNAVHYAVMLPWLVFMLYSEGYKGFHKAYSPRVAARAIYLRKHSTWIRVILAPVFCMGFFHSTRKRKIVVCVLLVGVASLVILFRFIPQPWRGILDLGVVLGLSWGILATLFFFGKYWFTDSANADPEIPTTFQ